MSKYLSRRTFLRGAGTLVALPFLDAMLPAFGKSAPEEPLRLMYVYAPSGMIPQYWNPKSTGTDFEFERIMKPLEKFRKDILVMSGLSGNPRGAPLNDAAGAHASAVASYMTGVRPKKTLGADFRAGVSGDQIAARSLGARTKFPSLEITCEDSRSVGECDAYTCAYQTISWKSPTEPLPREMNPRLLFERMFGDMDLSGGPGNRRNQAAYRQSILDLTLQDTKRLQKDLGPTDRRKLDEYLTSVRELEIRLNNSASAPSQGVLEGLEKPTDIPANYAEHARLLFDLCRIAFQTDMTRVITFMLAREGGVRPYPEIGVPEAHHSITHHGNDPVLVEKVAKIECYHMEQFAYFVEQMKAAPAGTTSLLDQCAIVYGASMADPNRHDHGHCPTLIVGNARNRIKTGRHIEYAQGTPVTNLHLSLLDLVGVPTDSLGNSSGKLEFLTDV